MRWHSPRRFGIETGDILVVTKDGLDRNDWPILVLLPPYAAMAALFAAVPLVPTSGPKEPALFWWLLASSIGGAVAVTGARWFRRYRRSLGCWRVGPDAIEFVGAREPARRLAWTEVVRVRWFQFSFKLEGPPGAIGLTRGGLPDDAWGRVRAAVEAALSPRFNLDEILLPSELPWWRVPIASLPPCVLIGGEVLLLRGLAMSPRALSLSLLAMLALLAGYCVLLSIWSRREWARRTWRYPRSGSRGEG